MINMIVAADENNTIGKDNDLIWHLPDDLKYFKRMTSGHTIIMGRRTFESVGKPLPNRVNIIITRDTNYTQEGCVVVHSLEEALTEAAKTDPHPFIVGGAQIYELALPITGVVFLTRIHHKFDGDRHFPPLGNEWLRVDSVPHDIDDNHKYEFTFHTYKRR